MQTVKQYFHYENYQTRPFPWTTFWIMLAIIPFILLAWWGIYPSTETVLTLRYAQATATGTSTQFLLSSSNYWHISPIYTFILAIFAFFNLPLALIATLLSAIGWSVAAIVCSQLLKQIGYHAIAILTPILLLFSPWLFMTVGSHLPWIMAVGWLAFMAAHHQNQRKLLLYSLLLLGISISWTAVSLIIILFIWNCIQHRTFLWKMSLILLIPIGLAIAILIWQATRPFSQFPAHPIEWWYWWRSLVNSSELFWLFLPLTIIAIWRQPQIWAIAFWMGFTRLEATFSGQNIIAINMLLLATIGIAETSRWLVSKQKIALDDQLARFVVGAILFIPLIWAYAENNYGRYQQRPHTITRLETEAGQWVKEHSDPTDLILGSAAIGYHANRPTLIWNGRTGNQENVAQLLHVLTQDPPQTIVTNRTALWQEVTNLGWFNDNYTQVQQFNSPIEPSAPLTIWQYQPNPLIQAPIQPLNIELQNGAKLVGYQQWPPVIQPGDAVHVALHWQKPISRAFVTVAWLPGPLGDSNEALRDMITPRALPPNWLQDGQTITEQIVLTTTEKIATGGYQINVSFREQNSFDKMPFYRDQDANPLDRIQLGYVAVPWNGTIPEEAAQLQIKYGNEIQLVTAEYPAAFAQANDQLALTLYWQTQADQQPQENYTIFVQLLNENGELSTSGDSPPMGGQYATRAWLPNHTIPDTHYLNLPADIAPGTYTIKTGLYLPETGQRLPAFDETGTQLPDNAYPLMTIEVE